MVLGLNHRSDPLNRGGKMTEFLARRSTPTLIRKGTLSGEEMESHLLPFRNLDRKRRSTRAFLQNTLFWRFAEGTEEINGMVAVLTSWALTTNATGSGLPGEVPLCIVEAALYRITGYTVCRALREQTLRTLGKIALCDAHTVTILLRSLNEQMRKNGHRVRFVHHPKAGLELKPFPVLRAIS